MAHPKRQHSVQRQRKRRTHDSIKVASFSKCSNCEKPILSHRVCPFCGHYKGQVVVAIKQPKRKKKEHDHDHDQE